MDIHYRGDVLVCTVHVVMAHDAEALIINVYKVSQCKFAYFHFSEQRVWVCLDTWRWKGNSNFLSLEGRKPSPVTNTHSSAVAPTYSLSWNRLLHMNTPTLQVPCDIFIFISYRILCPEKIIDDLHDSHHHCSEYLCRWFLYLCNISSILLKMSPPLEDLWDILGFFGPPL